MALVNFCAALQSATRQTGALPANVITRVMMPASTVPSTEQKVGKPCNI
jgi:hypothetical protein